MKKTKKNIVFLAQSCLAMIHTVQGLCGLLACPNPAEKEDGRSYYYFFLNIQFGHEFGGLVEGRTGDCEQLPPSD